MTTQQGYLQKITAFLIPEGKKLLALADITQEKKPPGRTLTGMVTGPTGKPIAGAEIINQAQSSNDTKSAKTDDRGMFILNDVNTYWRNVLVKAKGFASGPRSH